VWVFSFLSQLNFLWYCTCLWRVFLGFSGFFFMLLGIFMWFCMFVVHLAEFFCVFFFHIMGDMDRIMLACSPLLPFFFADFCICFSFYL